MNSTNYEYITNFNMYNYETVSYTMDMVTGNIKTCKPTEFEELKTG